MLREENWYKVHFTDESKFNLFGSEKRMSSGRRCAEVIQSTFYISYSFMTALTLQHFSRNLLCYSGYYSLICFVF